MECAKPVGALAPSMTPRHYVGDKLKGDTDPRSILDRIVGTSVSFNGLLIPASTLAVTLSRYVDNLVVWNDHQTYKVSLVGSAVPIRFLGHYFLLCTNHQLRGCRLENVSLLGRDGKNLVTSSGVRHFNDESNPHYRDLAAFEFTESCEAYPGLKERFFDLREVPPRHAQHRYYVRSRGWFPIQGPKVRTRREEPHWQV
jgi:hypothetical protein